MQALFGSAFSTPVNVDVYPTVGPDRRFREGLAVGTGLPLRHHIFSAGDDIAGDVKIGVGGGRKLDHSGVKIELKGVIGPSQPSLAPHTDTPSLAGAWTHFGHCGTRALPL